MHIDGKTQLIGLIGHPVEHSLSPAMHNAAAAALGLNWVYVPLPVPPDQLAAALRGLPALGYRGVNVTVPYKEATLPLLSAVYPVAQVIGAVNTIVVSGPLLTGFNTDWSGFLADLGDHEVVIDGRDCLVLGAGGAARAITYALLSAGGRVTVLARRPEQAESLAGGLRTPFPKSFLRVAHIDDLAAVAEGVYRPVIVNTTPLGMTGALIGASAWPDDTPLPKRAFVYDLVYAPETTRLLQRAVDAGCRTANGLGMLIHQAAEAFELWTGRTPDITVMREAIESRSTS